MMQMKNKLEKLQKKANEIAKELKCEGRFEFNINEFDEKKDINEWIILAIDNLEEAWHKTNKKDHANAVETFKKEKTLQEFQNWCYKNLIKEPSKAKCFYKVFEEVVVDNPNSIAITYEDEYRKIEWTYQQLNLLVNQLAYYLIALKEKNQWPNGTCIALFFENSPEAVVNILAVMKAGLAYVPLTVHQELNNERLADYVISSHAVLIICQHHLLKNSFVSFIKLKKPKIPVQSYNDITQKFLMDSDENNTEKELEDESFYPSDFLKEYLSVNGKSIKNLYENPNYTVNPDQLAYIIFSSGSTGPAKGIKIAHRGLCAPANAIKLKFNIKPNLVLSSGEIIQGDRIGGYALITFDPSIVDLTTALVSAATLVIIPSNILNDPRQLMDYMQKQKISIITLVPSLLRLLDPSQLPDLRAFISTGEPGDEKIFDLWASAGREHTIPRLGVNGYGPTEGTAVTSLADYVLNNLNIGLKAIPGLKWHVLSPATDENPYPRNPKKINVAEEGELYITGENVGLGYVNEAHYQQRFRAIFLTVKNHQKLDWVYQTGDLVQINTKDKTLKFIQRIDEQYKFIGQLIHPGAIEAAILQYKDQDFITRSKVIVDKGTDDALPFIRAFIQLKDTDKNFDEKTTLDIYFYLKHHAYCTFVPVSFSVIGSAEQWPRNINGKIDGRALIKQEFPTYYASHPFCKQASDINNACTISKKLAEIWTDLLKLRGAYKMRLDDNFYALGGNSILAAELFSEVCKLYPKYVKNFKRFNIQPTIRTLSFQIRSAEKLILHPVTWLTDASLFKKSIQEKKFPVILINSVLGDAAEDFQHLISYWQDKLDNGPLLSLKALSLDEPGYF